SIPYWVRTLVSSEGSGAGLPNSLSSSRRDREASVTTHYSPYRGLLRQLWRIRRGDARRLSRLRHGIGSGCRHAGRLVPGRHFGRRRLVHRIGRRPVRPPRLRPWGRMSGRWRGFWHGAILSDWVARTGNVLARGEVPPEPSPEPSIPETDP